MESAPRQQPDLVPPPRPPARWRDWQAWRSAARVAALGALGLVLLFLLAVPRFGGARCSGSPETTAISTLRQIESAEAQALGRTVIDVDADGRPEYGGFRELSGGALLRGRDDVIDPPTLSGVFRSTDATGAVRRSGYVFRLHVPTEGDAWISPDVAPGHVRPDCAETGFRCYAWPVASDSPYARRTFVVDQTGTILGTDDSRYRGSSGPAPGAAPCDTNGLVPGTGGDGAVWVRVN